MWGQLWRCRYLTLAGGNYIYSFIWPIAIADTSLSIAMRTICFGTVQWTGISSENWSRDPLGGVVVRAPVFYPATCWSFGAEKKIAKITPWNNISQLLAKLTPAILNFFRNLSSIAVCMKDIKNLEEYIRAGSARRYPTKWNVTHRRTCRQVYPTLQHAAREFISW